jgi:hypothetical protein
MAYVKMGSVEDAISALVVSTLVANHYVYGSQIVLLMNDHALAADLWR